VLPVTGTQVDPGSWEAAQRPASKPAPSVLTAIRDAQDRHRDLIRNTLTLLATTGVSLVLGFGYWNIAARLFSQTEVGYGSAAISAMTLLSSFGTFGLNTLLVGTLPKRTERGGLIAAAMLAAALGSLVLAVGFVTIAPHFTSHYDEVAGTPGKAAIFCCGVALTGAAVVFDAATIGMLRGGLQLSRNIAFVLTKILTLVGAALLLHYTTGIGIFASWVAAIPVSLVVVAVRIWVGSHALSVPIPDWTTLRSLRRSLAAHNWLNLALQMPVLLVPVLAASILAPSVNAAYYVATTILGGLFILPAHMSTVLFAMGAADPGELPGRLRFGLRVSLLVGLAGMIVLGVGAHFILGVFGAGYAQVATTPLRIMVLAYLPNVPNLFYIAVARATNKLSRAARLVSVFTVLNISAVVFGAVKYGVIGVALAGLAVGTVESLVTTPIVLRAARGLGRHRRAATAAATSTAAVGPQVREQRLGGARPPADGAHRERQLRALGVLMSLATPNTVTMMAISDNGPDTPPPRVPTRAPLADPGDFERGERTF
jgi:O-antigen/teichoic acid export membrane protein